MLKELKQFSAGLKGGTQSFLIYGSFMFQPHKTAKCFTSNL